MYCPNCGRQVEDGTRSCHGCGSDLEGIAPDSDENGQAVTGDDPTAPTPVITNVQGDALVTSQPVASAPAAPYPVYAVAGDPTMQNGGPTPGNNRQTAIIIGAIAATVVIVAVVVGIILFQSAEADRARTSPRSVSFIVAAQDYTDADTSIPIRATGTDLDGQAVDELFFVRPEAAVVELRQGDYEFSFPASPLTATGNLYRTPAESVPVVIGEGADGVVDLGEYPITGFDPLLAIDQTDELIQAAFEYASMDPEYSDVAEEYKQKAIEVHEQAVAEKAAADKKAAEEEAARKAAEEAAAKQAAIEAKKAAGRYFECPYYIIDIPDSYPDWTIDMSGYGPMKQMGPTSMGADVRIKNKSGDSPFVAVYSSNWGIEGSFLTKNLGSTIDGYHVEIGIDETKGSALLDLVSQWITVIR